MPESEGVSGELGRGQEDRQLSEEVWQRRKEGSMAGAEMILEEGGLSMFVSQEGCRQKQGFKRQER